MLKWNSLHQVLERVSDRHRVLASRFEMFAKHVSELATAPNFHIKGIGCVLHLDDAFFVVSFAGRNVYFEFASVSGDGGQLIGRVRCYVKRDLPQMSIEQVGEFTFTGNGESTLHDPESGDVLCVHEDLQALHIALNYLHECLAH